MANLGNVIKIKESDYNALIENGTAVIGGVTRTYDPNAMYLIEDTPIHLYRHVVHITSQDSGYEGTAQIIVYNSSSDEIKTVKALVSVLGSRGINASGVVYNSSSSDEASLTNLTAFEMCSPAPS